MSEPGPPRRGTAGEGPAAYPVRRLRWLAIWALASVAAVGAAFLVGTQVSSPWDQPGSAGRVGGS